MLFKTESSIALTEAMKRKMGLCPKSFRKAHSKADLVERGMARQRLQKKAMHFKPYLAYTATLLKPTIAWFYLQPINKRCLNQ